jgi:hypothetical protein
VDRKGHVSQPQVEANEPDTSIRLSRIFKNRKFGFIDRSGKVVIEPQFDWVEDFSEGLALVSSNGLSGLAPCSRREVTSSTQSTSRGSMMNQCARCFLGTFEIRSYRDSLSLRTGALLGPSARMWLGARDCDWHNRQLSGFGQACRYHRRRQRECGADRERGRRPPPNYFRLDIGPRKSANRVRLLFKSYGLQESCTR